MIDFKQYIKELQSISISEITEHSKRFALETLLRELAINCAVTNKINVLHEPKRKDNYGSPDFKIYTDDLIIGYVENKKINENLDKIIKSEQIKKYRELSQNLLITNYIEFVWIKGEMIQRETLCYLSDIENKKYKLDENNVKRVEKLLLNFFSKAPEKISNPKDLALALAVRCKNLKDFVHDELLRQEQQNEQERLYDLYNAFKENIFTELTISEFADAFAQMLAYGLFLAGLNADTQAISLDNAKKYIPSSFQLIKELISFLDELEKPEYKETKWIIDEIISIINNIQWADLKQNLSFNKQIKDTENIETDPYIYFYETFLATYDSSLRKSKGVYYTPPQVVQFIVRSIDQILQSVFKLSNGLADRNKVTLLDFATGTGTFLLEVFKVVLENIPIESPEKRKMIIKDHILQNLYGFEYLIAPYTIAHLKLSQFLKENSYEFQEKDRLQVYLTNTLEPVDKQVRVPFMPQLSKETQSAQKVKDMPILVITGNPPYSGHSKNNGQWIKSKIKDYCFVDGQTLGERNPKWLNDDYVKFIRFAQEKMDKAEQGMVAIITNHSFLDNPTFRGMRQSLMTTFDQLYFIDLHGNSSKQESTPEGEKDENVFDIKQGVCISILIKKKGLKKGVFHTDFWGKRSIKYDLCLQNSLKSLEFKELQPSTPFYLFVPQNQNLRTEYDKFWSLKTIFEVNGVGITTAHDEFCIDFEKKTLLKKFNDFKKEEGYAEKLHQKFNVHQKEGWNILKGWQNLQNETNLEKFIKPIVYRPFDIRSIFYEEKLVWRAVTQVMKHFEQDNRGLISVRQVAEGVFNHVFVINTIANFRATVSNKGGAYIFPLYRYNTTDTKTFNYLFQQDNQKDNFTESFRNFIITHYSIKNRDKKSSSELEKSIKELQKQVKQIDKLILSFEKSKFDLAIIENQKQLEEELNTQIELKKKELQVSSFCMSSSFQPNPEQIFGYIYAVLNSKTYREKYADFLKMDFPKIPFPETLTTFQTLSKLGEELVEAHVHFDKFDRQEYKSIGSFAGEGDNRVLKPVFKTEKLYINASQYFDRVSQETYRFQIGGYQILDKYLKDRKNRKLTFDDVETIENIIKVLTFTINQMELIDKETQNWI